MQSIIDIVHKNFQDNHTNSRRFPGFLGVVDTLLKCPCNILMLSVTLISAFIIIRKRRRMTTSLFSAVTQKCFSYAFFGKNLYSNNFKIIRIQVRI